MAVIPRNPKAAEKPAAAPAAAPASAPASAPAAGNEPGPAAGVTAEASASATTGTAVAPAAVNAVSTRVATKPVDVIQRDYKDALKVDWNTLHRIMVNQGNFLDKEDGNKSIGNVLVIELLSYQDSWQISPGVQGAEAAELVRYSDDGMVTTNGEVCADYLTQLKESGYDDAKMGKRVVVAGTVLECPGGAYMVNKMIQMDLSPTSKNLFDRHRLQIAMDIGKGIRTEDSNWNILKLGTQTQTKGTNTWTMATFGYAG